MLANLEKKLVNEYKVKYLGKAKTIIGWNITCKLAKKTLKIDQLLFIKNLLEEKNLTKYNVHNILIKAVLFIEIIESDDHNEVNLTTYQQFIGKLIYLVYGTRPDIAFAVRRLSKYNVDLYKDHLRASKRVIFGKDDITMADIWPITRWRLCSRPSPL